MNLGRCAMIAAEPAESMALLLDFQEHEGIGVPIEFRLTYQGPLPADKRSSRSRRPDKQRIRKHFHQQLKQLWKTHPALRWQAEELVEFFYTPSNLVSRPGPGRPVIDRARMPDEPGGGLLDGAKPWVEHVGDNFDEFGYRFVPLVRRDYGITCALDILFLRRDAPGDIVSGGDIDNRIKTLLDGLQKPKSRDQLAGYDEPGPDEDPFFCLLEDDSLISRISVDTDRLLTQREPEERESEVYLVITVSTFASDPTASLAAYGLA